MNKFEKQHIGKGKKHDTYDIVTVTIDMEKAEKLAYVKEGKKYLTFEVAALKEVTEFGKTHTAYVNKMVKEEETTEPTKD